jgi:N-acetylneuraminate synthase/N,N'-diacetyllegionaminate synthase
MFKRCELASDSLADLADHCRERGVAFISTPTSEAGVADLVRLGADAIKNGSDYLTHLPLIARMADCGLPVILSTGMATTEEIDDAVATFRRVRPDDLVLLHCTSSYPTPPPDVHLRKIAALRERYNVSVGLSDHTVGPTAAIGAVALGACVVEKHFTLDRTLPGPDHAFSVEPDDLRGLVAAVETARANLGDAKLGPTSGEQRGRRDFRLSCVAARDLSAGDVLTAADIVFRRPGTGFLPKEADQLVGRTVVVSIGRGHVLTREDFS